MAAELHRWAVQRMTRCTARANVHWAGYPPWFRGGRAYLDFWCDAWFLVPYSALLWLVHGRLRHGLTSMFCQAVLAVPDPGGLTLVQLFHDMAPDVLTMILSILAVTVLPFGIGALGWHPQIIRPCAHPPGG